MATKKEQQSFIKRALEYILSIGAKEGRKGTFLNDFKLDTKVGELKISLEIPEKGNIFSIYCRFEDTGKAKEFLGDNERLNQYSGKFNFHYTDADWTLKLFKEEIKPIL